MTKLLLRIFIKDLKSTGNADTRLKIGKLAGIMGIVCNILLFIGKITVGFLSHSVSIIADAANNLFDVSSSVVTLLGFRLASRSADKEHPFGHARYEYLSGIAVAVIILFVGIELVKSSVQKIITPADIIFSPAAILVPALSVLVKLWMAVFYKKTGKMIDSSTLKAAALDSRNDVFATLGVLLGIIVNRFFDLNIDGFIGLLVAVFIIYSGIVALKDTISSLLGKQADKHILDEINKAILCDERVLGFHDLLIHDYGPGKYFASVHVEINAEEDPLKSHDLIDKIESDVMEKLGIHLVIHYDPVLLSSSEWQEMKTVVEDILSKHYPTLSMHDFRIVSDDASHKLIFDLDIPYSMNGSQFEIKKKIEAELVKQQKNYTVVIRFDFK